MNQIRFMKIIDSTINLCKHYDLKILVGPEHITVSNSRVSHVIPTKLSEKDFAAAIIAVLSNLSPEYKRRIDEQEKTINDKKRIFKSLQAINEIA